MLDTFFPAGFEFDSLALCMLVSDVFCGLDLGVEHESSPRATSSTCVYCAADESVSRQRSKSWQYVRFESRLTFLQYIPR